MNLEKVCIIGFKVLLAIGTGIAVFAGIEQVVKSSNSSTENENQENNNVTFGVEETGVAIKENKFLNSLKATQDACGKILTIVGALSTAVESIASIFGGRGNSYYDINPPFYTSQSGYWVPPVNNTGKPELYRRTRYIQVCC